MEMAPTHVSSSSLSEVKGRTSIAFLHAPRVLHLSHVTTILSERLAIPNKAGALLKVCSHVINKRKLAEPLRASAMDVLVALLVLEESRKLPFASSMDW